MYTAVGHAIWAGVGFLIVVALANGVACKVFEKLTVSCIGIPPAKFIDAVFLQEKQMNEKDKRMKLLTELLNGIKVRVFVVQLIGQQLDWVSDFQVIKLYAWEPAFQRQIENIRSRELRHIRNAAYVGGMMEFAWNCTTIFVSILIPEGCY